MQVQKELEDENTYVSTYYEIFNFHFSNKSFVFKGMSTYFQTSCWGSLHRSNKILFYAYCYSGRLREAEEFFKMQMMGGEL